MHSSYNPMECHISKVRYLPPRGLLIWMAEIYFGTLGNSFSSASLHKPSGVLSLRNERSGTGVLVDGRSR
jgi:hypothetical protein